MSDYPLDLQRVSYSYLERPNRSILRLLGEHVLGTNPAATILDVGCGCGANARAVRDHWPSANVIGIEPNATAAAAAEEACTSVFNGMLEEWLAQQGASAPRVDAILLSDVLEHIADPVGWLRSMSALPQLRGATWIISVPNFGVWYNRLRTLAGRFEYAWSGLYDRTHLRFYTRASIRRMLAYCGFAILADRGTASLVQSAAPLLRRSFDRDVTAGDHLALLRSPRYRLYQRFVEPAEEGICNVWPSLLAFQIVLAARLGA